MCERKLPDCEVGVDELPILIFVAFCFGWTCGSFFDWFLPWIDGELTEVFEE